MHSGIGCVLSNIRWTQSRSIISMLVRVMGTSALWEQWV